MERLDPAAVQRELDALAMRHQQRRRRTVETLPDPARPERVRVEGRDAINFCSNDYLGLRAHPALIAAAGESMRRYGFGSGAAHLVTGHCSEHRALEEELAAFTGRERALLFSSGYLANLGALSALAGRHALIVADRLNHASLLDAARLAGARLRRYAHAQPLSAASVLASHA